MFRKPGIEASFPAFGPPAVVVLGTALATGRISTEWVLTVLHEHLHQLQYAAPDYYEETEALDLADADDTGMWMLGFSVSVSEDATIGREFAELALALRSALVDESDSDALEEPWILLRRLLGRLELADARYVSFQLWQEGIGRYVEMKAARFGSGVRTQCGICSASRSSWVGRGLPKRTAAHPSRAREWHTGRKPTRFLLFVGRRARSPAGWSESRMEGAIPDGEVRAPPVRGPWDKASELRVMGDTDRLSAGQG